MSASGVRDSLGLRRRIALVAAAIFLCLGIVATRAVWEGRSALADGDSAAQAGDLPRAIALWRRAARWYVPLAPHVGAAYDRLEALAAAAEQNGDTATALAAWTGIRGSILATRSFYTPQAGRLDPANQHIATLMARIEGAAADAGKSEAERSAWHLALLSRDEAPSVPWVLVALAGFAMWIGGGLRFALRAITPEDTMVPRIALTSGILVAAGLFLWMLGLHNA
jgi:hypothetical protein